MEDLARVKAYLRIAPEVTKDDATLRLLEAGAWAFVAGRTGRYFGPVEVTTEYVHGTGSRELWLRDAIAPDGAAPEVTFALSPEELYEAALHGVAVVALPPEEWDLSDGTRTAAVKVDGVSLAPEAFSIRPHPRSPRLVLTDPAARWECGFENVEATYRRGYSVGTEPADILSGVLGLVAVRFRRLGMEGLASEDVAGDIATSLPATHVFSDADIRLVPALESTLNLWRRRNV